jgi:phosphoesterase RecJ-like protein
MNMNETGNPNIRNNTAATVALLKDGGRETAIIIHINPDGDALGSGLGMLKLLNNMGHPCTVISPNGYPGFLKWLPGNGGVLNFGENPGSVHAVLKKAELVFALDFNEPKRMGDLYEAFAVSPAHKVLIDHHPGPQDFTDCILSDTTASSTAELVFRFIQSSGFLRFVDADVATCLYMGMMTDTGCFSYNSSNRKTWETVASLLDYGINKDAIYYRIYDNFSISRMQLLGYSLNEKMEYLPAYRTAFIVLTRGELEKFDFQVGDTEGFVNYPLSIGGIRFSALFIEKEDHIKISFRSKGGFAVNNFSRKYFNGGGHANASGGESNESLEATVKRFRDLLPLHREELLDYEI